METKKIEGIKNNEPFKGNGDFFDTKDEKDFNALYFDWKEFNAKLVKYGCRRTNFPEIISEGLSAYLFSLARTNNCSFSGMKSSSFDCIDPNDGKTYQIKAVSTMSKKEYGGPTSFGPHSEYDVLILVHIVVDEDRAYFYIFDENINNIMVNEIENFADQCARGVRPRFSLLKETLKNGYKPCLVYSFRRNNDTII